MRGIALATLLLLAAPSDEITYTAQSVNVAESGTPAKIKILRWSTEDERRPIVTALAAPPAQPSDVAQNAARAGAARGRGAGRGRGRGGPGLAPLTPIAAFTAAIGRAPTVGYLWTSDITGYSIKYAWHMPLADGTERVILVSNRRLDADTSAWQPSPAAPETDYAFTLIELRVGPKGLIEGKTSLAAKVVVDSEANTVALDNYATAAVSLATSTAGKLPRPSR